MSIEKVEISFRFRPSTTPLLLSHLGLGNELLLFIFPLLLLGLRIYVSCESVSVSSVCVDHVSSTRPDQTWFSDSKVHKFLHDPAFRLD